MTATVPSAYADWRETYKSRCQSADEAMRLIHDGDLVGLTILAPAELTAAFERRAKQLDRVDIRLLAPRELQLFTPDGPRGEKEIELFIGDISRPSHDARITTYLPNTFMLGMKAFDDGRPEARLPDVFLTPCSPPNEAGYVHFGPHMWNRKAYIRRCKRSIAMIDPNMMPVHGDVWLHVSEIDAFVEGVVQPVDMTAMARRIEVETPPENRPALRRLLGLALPEQIALVQDRFPLLPPDMLERALGLSEVDEASKGIAANLRELIREGATIQIGVGEPSQLMVKAGAFDVAHGLGIHTELGSPGLAQLWQRGIVDNARKRLHHGASVAVAWSGCDGEDMRIIRDNPAFQLYDPDYLLNPLLMAQNPRMTSINSAVAVDVLGQIASEDRFGGNMINGTGGQPDTHISAALCKDGRAITVMRSTALAGSVSKVVARHEAGTLITIPRYLADTIVTEHGVARLLDKNHRQRAAELISIAHPDFRAELRKEAAKIVGEL
ncbi:MAG TPA: acetyl-CoA hydrolase/transferase C-terminal domain-containing protein [Dehalococcoidia bacterium]|nr:acetyl-CoA hydrolase/transferase C-terminal domain-containing protein [Dehalococcoidia bacterium]